MSNLEDSFGRKITYLRLAITDRCNLRCRYCMPPSGIDFVPHGEILRFEEMEYLVGLLISMGVVKLRITGGEPFARRGVMDFLSRLSRQPGLESLHITTNGVEASQHLPALKKMGISGINLSLDTLIPGRFEQITGQNALHRTLLTLDSCLELGIQVKINTVIQDGVNDDEIVGMAEMARRRPLHVRFIERMPFSGCRDTVPTCWSTDRVLGELSRAFPGMEQAQSKTPSTSRLFSIPGFRGMVGVIGGYSRVFCGSCNKVRITPLGTLKTCLYDGGALDLKHMLRNGASENEIKSSIAACVYGRAKDGFHAETLNRRLREAKDSMASIGG